MRRPEIFEILQSLMDQVPQEKRSNMSIKYGVAEENVSHNVEEQYRFATSRLTQLDFNLEWAKYIEESSKKPVKDDSTPNTEKGVSISFHDFENMPEAKLKLCNEQLASWVRTLVLRDFHDFFLFYLMGIFETCSIIRFKDKDIKPDDIDEGLDLAKQFEAKGLKDRLKILRNKFSFKTPRQEELTSLKKVRDVLAHYDGIVETRVCDKQGRLRVKWPVNQYKLKNRKTGKYECYDELPLPLYTNDYSECQIAFLKKPKVAKYQPGNRIDLSYRELKELLFFYMHIFNEYQKDLISYAKAHDVPVREFEEYEMKLSVSFVGEFPDDEVYPEKRVSS